MRPVICVCCGGRFDRDKEPFETIGRRYAHLACYEARNGITSDANKNELHEYIKLVFQSGGVPVKIQQQIKDLKKKYPQFTDAGILNTLRYVYEVKKSKRPNLNDGIYFIPYVYEEASKYYYQIWLTNQKSENEEIANLPEDKVVYVKPRERQVRKSMRFGFLDWEEK